MILKKALDFYINSSIHVALSCFVLVHMTGYMFHISNNNNVAYFAFFGTIFSYNFIKYFDFIMTKKGQVQMQLKVIVLLSLLSLLFSAYFFLRLSLNSQIISLLFLTITALYCLPFFPNRKNARNWAGIKIYIVALCWVGITVVIPIINAEIAISFDFYLKCIQRFLLIFVLILIFEIIDLQTDDLYLQTVPQKIGVKRTKFLGYGLLIVFCLLEIIKNNFEIASLLLVTAIASITVVFLYYANEGRSKYYTSFWVESIPVFWYCLLLIFN